MYKFLGSEANEFPSILKKKFCLTFLIFCDSLLNISFTVWEILAKAVNDWLTRFYEYLLLAGQEGFRAAKMLLRRHSNPDIECRVKSALAIG